MNEKRAYDILFNHWGAEVPVNVIKMAKNLGLTIDFGDGYSITDNHITIKSRDSTKRERFVIAHMIGHYVLNHGDQIDDVKNFSIKAFGIEKEANKFAVELLMPEVVVNHLIFKKGVTDISSLADYFSVSQVALSYRLKQLGLL